ncbi:hypothetical protein GMLC_39610 [Geomonas limicola]|uniref:Uncharacterized protein n=1 Tax=Geomonas limicola TaxID=2740186 RepID=A0A6V8NCM2_9BACT|nr:hypothetical protein GMLC_39610 [Geomonas limicola]
MRNYDYFSNEEDDPWASVQLTKEAIRARSTLMIYTVLLTAPFVTLVAFGAHFCGLKPHEVLGISCYKSMLSALFFFDTLRNAAHECFDEAKAGGLVSCPKGVPVIDPSYPHRRLARLSFAIGGRITRSRDR